MRRMINPRKKMVRFLEDLEKYRSEKKAEGQEIYHRLKEQYPYEKYGVAGELTIEGKMQKYIRHMKEVDICIRCLENSIWSLDDAMSKYEDVPVSIWTIADELEKL